MPMMIQCSVTIHVQMRLEKTLEIAANTSLNAESKYLMTPEQLMPQILHIHIRNVQLQGTIGKFLMVLVSFSCSKIYPAWSDCIS